MSDFLFSPPVVETVSDSDKKSRAAVQALLADSGIRLDPHIDYQCAIFDDDRRAVATGSCFKNTLRCFAVRADRQGEGLLNSILSHLLTVQTGRGYTHLFLYTKPSAAKFFASNGFYELARSSGQVVFMENRRRGFSDYLDAVRQETAASDAGSGTGGGLAVVMNANPFTLGHAALIEAASAAAGSALVPAPVHVFVLSEDTSLFPADVRYELVRRGCAPYKNVVVHKSGPYMISCATFPSYFQKDEDEVIASYAELDARVFIRIAHELGITGRYIGQEPASRVTAAYNRVLLQRLPEAGIACTEIPRRTAMTPGGEMIVSASTVRTALQTGDQELLRCLVPDATFAYLQSPAAAGVIEAVRHAGDVVHY